jgi:phage N-6-adenine-methyltransferase
MWGDSMSEINPGNENDDFRTPRDLFTAFNDRFDFTLDVAASKQNSLCVSFFDKDTDGLKQKWTGSVWCNPPYSNPEAWLSKGLAELEVGNCETVVYLLNVDTSTRWFHDLIMPFALEVHLIKGRIQFGGPHVCDGGANPKPSMVVVFNRQFIHTVQYLNCIDVGGMSTGKQTRLNRWI